MYNNNLKYYLVLKKINCSDKNIIEKIKKIVDHRLPSIDKSVYCFANKMKFNFKIYECAICYPSQALIPYDCSHFFCPACYSKINKCPTCNILKSHYII